MNVSLRLRAICFTAVLPVCTAVATSAAARHIDINPYDGDGEILTGFYDFDAATFIDDGFRFSEPLTIVQSTFHGVSAPGFFSGGDRPLRPSTNLTFTVPAVTGPVSPDRPRTALYWDGLDNDGDGELLDDVAFADLPDGHTLQVRKSSALNRTVDGGSTEIDGFILEQTGSAGQIHEHVAYLIFGADSAAPDDGLYLLPMQLHQAGLESSDTIYMLFNGKFQRDGNGQILKNGILPRVNELAQAAAEQWLDDLFLTPGLAGDFDDSGFVGQSDLNLVLGNWGAATTPATFLANTDGLTDGVGQDELNAVLGNWGGQRDGGPSLSGAAVPEPTLAGALLGVLAWTTTRRRPTR
jgi:hypothetical protein